MASLEDRTSGFLSLLKDKGIGGSSKYLTEAQRIKSDPRYNLLSTDIERYQVFVKYVGERADEERKEKKERKDAFRALCEEKHKSDIDAREGSFGATAKAGKKLLESDHYASDKVKEKLATLSDDKNALLELWKERLATLEAVDTAVSEKRKKKKKSKKRK